MIETKKEKEGIKYTALMPLETFVDEIVSWDSGMIYLRKSPLLDFLDAVKGQKIKIVLEEK